MFLECVGPLRDGFACFHWFGMALNDFRACCPLQGRIHVVPWIWDGFDWFWSVSPPSGADSRVSIGLGWP